MPILDKDVDKYGNRSWKVTTNSSIDPITINEVKTFGRIDSTEEDSLIGGFITTVREAAEKYLGRSLIEQTITLLMDFWPSMVIELPLPPLISITGVYTVSESDVATEYSNSNYYTITNSTPGKLILKQGVSLPTNTDRDYGGFKIVYKAGYGSGTASVPQGIKEGLKLWATLLYENRSLTKGKEPPPEVATFLDLYKVYKI